MSDTSCLDPLRSNSDIGYELFAELQTTYFWDSVTLLVLKKMKTLGSVTTVLMHCLTFCTVSLVIRVNYRVIGSPLSVCIPQVMVFTVGMKVLRLAVSN